MASAMNTGAGWRGKLAWLALLIAIFTLAWFVAAALGSRFGLWSWQFGLGTMTIGWGPRLAMGAIGLAVVSLIVALIASPRVRPAILSIAALLIAGSVLGRLGAFGQHAASLPPIHDIQTDWSDPIAFSPELMAAREADGALNPVLPAPTIAEAANGRWPGLGGRLVSEVQEEAEFDPTVSDADPDEAKYPQIDTVTVSAPPGEVYEAAIALVEARGWETVTADREAGRIEATETSTWFGFRDDVAIRIRPADGGSEVDIRSVSRVGLSDLGANAKRVSEFLIDLQRELR